MKFDKPKGLKGFLRDQANKEVDNLFKCDAFSYYEIRGTSNYQYLFRYTSSSYTFKCCKYFICPYKHIITDYGYFIRFDGKPIAYKVKYRYTEKDQNGNERLNEFPNTLNEITGCFEIKYDYANAEAVINGAKANNLFILKKNTAASTGKLLKLDRKCNLLRVYKKADEKVLHKYYSIRPNFDSSGYDVYEKETEFKCIYGRAESPTPFGVFDITNKSMPKEAYVSGYIPKYDKVKFFGYLEIFEDYFIHSDMYEESVDELPDNNQNSISNIDCDTSGCIRISQEDLSWLIDNIEIGTPIIL